MGYERPCVNCGRIFEATRRDHQFCDERCKAQYDRDRKGGYRRRFHADLKDEYTEHCQWCGTPFNFNAYANRGGQRQPRFCCDSCRQKAWRWGKKWDTGAGTKGRDKQSGGKGPQGSKKGPRSDDRQKSDRQHQQGPNRAGRDQFWQSDDPWVVLGIDRHATKAQARARYRELLKRYHPDVCHDPDATRITQAINAAWDRVKNRFA
jgi:hypothetical protein